MLRYWNPWEKKDAQGNVIKAAPEFPFECKGGVCPYPGAKKKLEATNSTETASCAEESTKSEAASSSTTTMSQKKDDQNFI